VGTVRAKADISIEFPSGSARPVVGPAILFAKRLVRRGLRWYLAPIIEEQSRFNHSVLDLLEALRLQQERLRADLDDVDAIVAAEPPTPAILAARDELSADLIVLVTDAHGGLSSWSEPSTVQQLLRRPDLTLLLIREL
jgi:nucleotide-binding universal stress UspA family protein